MTDANEALEWLFSQAECLAENTGGGFKQIEQARQALSAPRVPEGWIEFVREVVESAEGYESRSGNKVNGNWVERGRALLTAAQSPAEPAQGELANLRERVKWLEGLISEHNTELTNLCDNKSKCGYTPYKRDCPNCPKDYQIEVSKYDRG